MIITTYGWEDDDNIGTSHIVLLIGDQHLAVLTSRLGMDIQDNIDAVRSDEVRLVFGA